MLARSDAPAALPALKLASAADDGTPEAEAEWRAEQQAAGHEADAPDALPDLDAQLTLATIENGDARLDELCERLARWVYSRRLWGAPRPRPDMQIGKLVKRTRALRPELPDAPCSAEMAALWVALCAQPADAIDRVVFELHYLHRVSNVKAASAAVGIGRAHWYRLLRDFRRRIYAASRDILDANLDAAAALPARNYPTAAPAVKHEGVS